MTSPSLTASPRSERRRGAVLATAVALACLLAFVLVACTPGPPRSPYTLRVLASSEIGDMGPVLRAAQDATGVKVDLTLTGSLAGAQQVMSGGARRKYDAVWFASDNYLNLFPEGPHQLNGTTEIMASPVVVGVRSSVARRLGWDNGHVTWSDIAAAAGRRQFTFAMTDPAMSNSGLSALVSVATAAAGTGVALQPAEIPRAAPELSALFHGQVMTAATSGALTRAYLRALRAPGGRAPDGLVDYESQLLTIRQQSPRGDPLTLVYPSDGALQATYPLSLLASAPAAARGAYQRLARYLTSQRAQEQIMGVTHRRPIAGNVPLSADLAGHQPPELPFPSARGTVLDLIAEYHGTLRTAGRTVYVLDTSGSMRGARLAALERALLALTGVDTTLPGRLSEFRTGEEITFLPFGTTPGPAAVYSIPSKDGSAAGAGGATLAKMRAYIAGLRVHGHTAIYDALVTACQILARQDSAAPGRIDSVVLLSDGGNNAGRGLPAFLAFYGGLHGGPPVYTIAFGEADREPLQELASATDGAAFDAVGQPPSALGPLFQEIRGFQ